MHIKLIPLVLITAAALLTSPGVGSTHVRSERDLDSHQISALTLSDQERILLLENFKDEQRDYNTQLDNRLINQINTVVETQNRQGKQINELESRLDLVYRFGTLIAFVLSLSVPVFLWIMNKSQAHNAKIASAIQTLASDVRLIKTVFNIHSENPSTKINLSHH